MPIQANEGVLDIENATLRSNAIVTLTNLVTGNDVVRSLNAPTLEVYGDPNNGGTEPTIEIVSNVDAGASSTFTRLTSNAGVFTIQSGTNSVADSKGDIAFTSIGGATEHMRIQGSTGDISVSSNLTVNGNILYTKPTSVLVDSNVVAAYTGPHGRGAAKLKKYPEIDFEEGEFDGNDSTNTYVQAGYTVSASSQRNDQNLFSWKAFSLARADYLDTWTNQTNSNYNGTDNTYNPAVDTPTINLGTGAVDGEWIKLELPNRIKLKHMIMYNYDASRIPEDFKLYGSDNNSNWTELLSVTGQGNVARIRYDVNATDMFKYYGLVITKITAQSNYFRVLKLEYYGYEEDPPLGDTSVDTTFTSVMNTPQTTGANVYVDAKLSTFTNRVVGPTPVGTAATHNDTGKYWELNGTLTSNISVEANTFLEGDQPHAVSVWFNSSNLEANVSNTCVFSISDQEKLDSVNLDLQSNTWHNLTYAYQGEGGSRVTYLDGRKVAEDQAEDTFGDYPPFAMTGPSQGGYVVSTSGTYDNNLSVGGSYAADHLFSKSTGPFWFSGRTYSNGQISGSSPTFPGTSSKGEWVQLYMPHKLKVSYIRFWPRATETVRLPIAGTIWASNTGKSGDWVNLHSWSGMVQADFIVGWNYITINASKYYKYFALQGQASSCCDAFAISQLEYYGHRENDLVRLPDPTNVLKYPHVAMSGYAQRGYVASTDNENSTLPVWKVFEDLFSPSDGSGDVALGINDRWQPNEQVYGTAGADVTAGGTTTLADSSTKRGNYIQLESPHKLNVTKYKIYSGTFLLAYRPTKVVMLGSNTGGSDWVDLGSGDTTLTYSGTHANYAATVSISNTSTYKYHRLVIRAVHSQALPVVYQLQFFGTEEGSVPIQIGGGNIDKVANFRVYDKFVGEDQALEIWDAQKDEFGRAKSSMTLYKGRLGLGTTEPEGRLAVLDEPHNLEEFPPRAMTGYKNHFEGHGEFCVSASSEYNAPRAYQAFDYKYTTWQEYIFTSNPYGTTTSPATYIGSESTAGYGGEWLELKLPYKIKLNKFDLSHRAYFGERMPQKGVILGRNDDNSEWSLVYTHDDTGGVYNNSRDNTGPGGTETRTFVVNDSSEYNTFRFVITKIFEAGTSDTPNISRWHLFGTREQGQSVLHDGQLTLTKNLNVPRIGPALDADDTPRRDRLVVEYNTSTNPTFEGAVRDTSGRGLDGVFVGGASYDATQKAFEFNKTDNQYVNTNIQSSLPTNGNFIHSMSMWFNPDSLTTTSGDAIVFIGDNTTNSKIEVFMESDRINYTFYGNSFQAYPTITNGRWYHLALTYNGVGGQSGRAIYLDGVQITATHSESSGVLNLANGNLDLGRYTPDGTATTSAFDGSLSQFKLYDCALTAEEVKTLYDMGRCDEGHHVVNFSKTRVGIGLGDGEAPQAALDVRGDIRYITMAPIALPTLYDHILAGRNGRGMYPILGTNGGTRVYNVYCEPDMYGGGWMCFSQIPRMPDKLVTTVQGRNWSLFADAVGNSGVLLMPTGGTGGRRHSTFSVPMNIIAAGGATGYDIDVLLMAYGDGLRTNGNEGAKVGAIWRGVNLQAAMNSEHASAVGSSGLASSSDGVDFTARSYTLFNSTGWDYSISTSSSTGSYQDQDDGTAGYIVHNNTSSGGFVLYCNAISGPGGSWDYSSDGAYEYVRFFVRPSSF
jgi:hypothetical protein